MDVIRNNRMRFIRAILLFVAIWQFRKSQALKRRRRILMLIRRREIQQNARRGLYCRMEFMNRDLAAIMSGDERKTREHIRMTPQSLMLFCSKLRRKLQGWSLEFEAIVYLYWMACGASFRVVACCFNIPRSTTHRIIMRVLKQTVGLINTVIKHPVGPELDAIGVGFEELCRSPVFSLVAGAIDGCQIRTLVPSTLHDEYINQKLFYSILMQGVVDHRGMFIDIFAGFPGSVHDMHALRHSSMYRRGTYPPEGHFLIGDEGYACILQPIALVAPYEEPLTPAKWDFNFHLNRGRCVIERAFGVMKARWRLIFTKALEVKLKTGVQVLAAAAVLHNICVSTGDILDADNVGEPVEVLRRPQRDETRGLEFRDLLLRLHGLHANE